MVLTLSDIQKRTKGWIEETQENYLELSFIKGEKKQTFYIRIEGKPKEKKIHLFFTPPPIGIISKNYPSCIQLQYLVRNEHTYLRLDDYYFEINKSENKTFQESCKGVEHVFMFEVLDWMALLFNCDSLILHDEASKRSDRCNWDLGLFQKIVRGSSFYEKYGFQYSSPLLRDILENQNLNRNIQDSEKLWTPEIWKWLKENRLDQLTVRELIEAMSRICMGEKTVNKWDKYGIYNELRWVIYAMLFFGKTSSRKDVMKCCFGFMPIDTAMEKKVLPAINEYKLEYKEGTKPTEEFDKKITIQMIPAAVTLFSKKGVLQISNSSQRKKAQSKRKSREGSQSGLRRSQRLRMKTSQNG